jgi:hypothetical protein
MGIKEMVLLIIGLATAITAILGLMRDRIYCKGGPYLRSTQPVAFWLSVIVYFAWSALMAYLVFLGRT